MSCSGFKQLKCPILGLRAGIIPACSLPGATGRQKPTASGPGTSRTSHKCKLIQMFGETRSQKPPIFFTLVLCFKSLSFSSVNLIIRYHVWWNTSYCFANTCVWAEQLNIFFILVFFLKFRNYQRSWWWSWQLCKSTGELPFLSFLGFSLVKVTAHVSSLPG